MAANGRCILCHLPPAALSPFPILALCSCPPLNDAPMAMFCRLGICPRLEQYIYLLNHALNCCHLGSLFLSPLVANAMYQHSVISSDSPMITKINVISGCGSA